MRYLVNGQEVELEPSPETIVKHRGPLLEVSTGGTRATALVVKRGDATFVSYQGRSYEVKPVGRRGSGASAVSSGEVKATMPGQIVDVLVGEADTVDKGQRIVVLEAMKMQQPLLAPHSGTVTNLKVKVGDQVSDGQVVFIISPATGDA